MSVTSENKKNLIKTYAVKENDTGSSFVQCAILTERIGIYKKCLQRFDWKSSVDGCGLEKWARVI
jgi:ribosomal protein S15